MFGMRFTFTWIAAAVLAIPPAGAGGNVMASTVPGPAALAAGMPASGRAIALPVRDAAAKSSQSVISGPLAVPFLTGIMHGHLLAALALAEINHHETAVIHSSHPIDENFAKLAPLLAADVAAELRLRLTTLHELMALRARRDEIMAAYQSATRQLQAIEDGASTAAGMADHQMLALVVAWLTQSADEYEEAWSGLELRNAAEYQDGYGFYNHAKAKLVAMLPRLRLADPAAATEIIAAAERIGMAWPAVIPPDKPAMATSTLRALVAVIEINARRFHV